MLTRLLLVIFEVRELLGATRTSDYSTSLSRPVLVARPFAKELGGFLTISVNISERGDDIPKGGNHLEGVLDLGGLRP
jgi:hypothetical protein